MKKRRILICIICSILLFFCIRASSLAKDVEDRENVLIVHSYNQGFSWTDELHRGIIEKLDPSQYNIYTEYLDAYRVNPIEDSKIDAIKSYSQKDISYIVVTDNTAFELILSLKEEYFPEVPVLFAGVNGEIKDLKFDDVKGIMQNVSYEEFLIWLNGTFPIVDKLLVCGAKTSTTAGTYDQMMSAYEKIGKNNLHFTIERIDIEDYDAQIQSVLAYDVDRTAIYSAGSFGVLNHDQYTNMLAQNTQMPTFCGVSTSISHEVLGGYVVSPYEHGSILGGFIVSMSEGTSIENIPFIEKPIEQIIFNYQGMKKFHIEASELPDNSIIINRPSDLITLTSNQVLMILFLFGFLLFIISALVIISNIRKKSNKQLKTLYKKLSESKNELQEYNEKIVQLVELNQLTQLMNDTKFFEVIKEQFKDAEKVTLISITITNLSKLALLHGKGIYEAILVNVGNFLTTICSEGTVLGITFDSDFLIAVEGEVDEKSEMMSRIVKYFEEPLISDLYMVILKYKIGIAYYPDQGKTFEQLYDYSNLGITSVIDNSLNNIAIFSEDILKNLNNENTIKNEIEIALMEHEFIMFYQPKYAMDGITITGLEALIRWNYKDGTLKSPGYFIDIAEQSGQVMKIGFYVMEEVCKAIKTYGLVEKNIPVAINLSGHHFASRDIINKLLEVTSKYQVPPHFLEIEITETTLIKNRAFSAMLLQELQDLGFTITLDDFGTGYASINYIKELPIDKIKIDQSFVQRIQDEKAQNLLRIMIQMANELDLDVTVEGIETSEQYKIVHDFGPKELQGYLFRRPVPLEEINLN